MNNVVLIGRLVSDPELRYVGEDSAISTFTLAVDKFVNGEKDADFIRCKVWGKQAESLAEYKKKGDQIGLNGHIETGSYETDSGEKRYTTEVVCERIEYLASKQEEKEKPANKNSKTTNKNSKYNKSK
jgi:single-strand DNA-binding protein